MSPTGDVGRWTDLADGKVECYTKFSPMPLDGPTVSNDPVFITLHDGDFVATERSTGTGYKRRSIGAPEPRRRFRREVPRVRRPSLAHGPEHGTLSSVAEPVCRMVRISPLRRYEFGARLPFG